MLNNLPPELVHGTCLYLPTTSLLSLACTHRSFTAIARERLLLNASIPLRSVPHYISLISKYPGRTRSVKNIELHDDSSLVEHLPYHSKAMAACRDLITKRWEGKEVGEWTFALHLYHSSPVLWTCMLFLALPRATALSLRPRSDDLPSAYEFILRNYTRKHIKSDLLPRLEAFVLKRLEGLDVRAPSYPHDPISVCHLSNLQKLVVDGASLRPRALGGYGSHQQRVLAATEPLGSLPLNLQMLKIYGSAETIPWTWLYELKFHQIPNRNGIAQFADLKIRLFIEEGWREVAMLALRDPLLDSLQNICARTLFWEWEKMGVDVETWFGVKSGAAVARKHGSYEEKSLTTAVEVVRREKEGSFPSWMAEKEKERMVGDVLDVLREREMENDRWWVMQLADDGL